MVNKFQYLTIVGSRSPVGEEVRDPCGYPGLSLDDDGRPLGPQSALNLIEEAAASYLG